MAGVPRPVDRTVQLPDEVLCHVISFLSLSDKLRSEAVNLKFQRCVLQELKSKPRTFRLESMRWRKLLNGHRVAHDRILFAIQSLAKKAKFSSICIEMRARETAWSQRLLEKYLTMLSSQPQSLTSVTSFSTDSGCSQAVLENLLNKCDKLSTIRFHCELDPEFPDRGFDALDVKKYFNMERLTDLKLFPLHGDQPINPDVFQSLVPNVLKNVYLTFCDMPVADIAAVISVVETNLLALEELRLKLMDVDGALAAMFESLARLPALRKCNIKIDGANYEIHSGQFVADMASLFKMSHVNVSVVVGADVEFVDDADGAVIITGCLMTDLIHQIQNVHPGLVVDFKSFSSIILTLGNVCFEKKLAEPIQHCGQECVQCQSFYPCLEQFLFDRLVETGQALKVDPDNPIEAQHFPNWQLDQCRVGKIFQEGFLSRDKSFSIKPVHLEQDLQSVTITFEIEVNGQDQSHMATITVSCGPCLTNGCIKC